MKRTFATLLLLAAPLAFAQQHLELKYVRDGAEYATLTRQVYRSATDAVLARAAKRARGSWGVVLDVDETTLDNSVYQLERAAYNLPYEAVSWGSWIGRAEAGTVPGVKEFLDAVRTAGGRVAFITDRATEWSGADASTKYDQVRPTRENLIRNGLFREGDLLCLKSGKEDTKAMRRRSVASGEGTCSWPGVRIDVTAFIGDQMGDFPQAGEGFEGAGTDAQFGRTFFLLPDPLYGGWTSSVTRTTGAFR
jgi:acid phosphatase